MISVGIPFHSQRDSAKSGHSARKEPARVSMRGRKMSMLGGVRAPVTHPPSCPVRCAFRVREGK